MSLFIAELLGSSFQIILFAIIPFIWWVITARKKENFFKWIGLKKLKKESSIIRTLFITVAATLIYSVLTSYVIKNLEGVATATSQFAGQGYIGIAAALAYGYLRTGLSEELIFRGFLLKRLSTKFGYVTGNILQALLFGLLHGVPFGIATKNIGVAILLTLFPGAFGYFQGWLNEKRFSGSIIPSWILHGTINFISVIAIL